MYRSQMFRVRRIVVRTVLIGTLVPFLVGCPRFSPPTVDGELVWPISGTEAPDGPLSSTFGPRLKQSEGGRYDFHRGIDIPVPVGTPVHAIARGEVRISGTDPNYSDMLVQLKHTREDDSVFYSNYIHLSEATAVEGTIVEAGDIIGLTGVGESGFPHLHFETRDGGLFQKNAVSPFSILPYDDANSPDITIGAVDTNTPGQPDVTVTVSLPRTNDQDELDFNAVTVSVLDTSAKGAPVLVDEHSYDMHAWNLAYTPTPPANPNEFMDDPDFNGVTVEPEPFVTASTEYVIHFTFYDLTGPADPASLAVTATATDVQGNGNEAVWP